MEQNRTAQEYKEYIGMFVTIERTNGRVAKGILVEITLDDRLKIKGDYNNWVISTENISDFSARQDRAGGSYVK